MATSHSISRDNANTEVRRFLRTLGELTDPNFINQLSYEAQQFFAPRYVSFVFYKDQLDALYNNVDANAYRVYFAQKGNSRPSIVIVPCNINDDETEVENRIAAFGDPGNQYPIPQTTQFDNTNFDIADD